MPFAVSLGCRIYFRGAGGLRVDAARMQANLEATGGAIFAEKAAEDRLPDIAGLTEPEGYLGSAEVFRRRLLEGDR